MKTSIRQYSPDNQPTSAEEMHSPGALSSQRKGDADSDKAPYNEVGNSGDSDEDESGVSRMGKNGGALTVTDKDETEAGEI